MNLLAGSPPSALWLQCRRLTAQRRKNSFGSRVTRSERDNADRLVMARGLLRIKFDVSVHERRLCEERIDITWCRACLEGSHECHCDHPVPATAEVSRLAFHHHDEPAL